MEDHSYSAKAPDITESSSASQDNHSCSDAFSTDIDAEMLHEASEAMVIQADLEPAVLSVFATGRPPSVPAEQNEALTVAETVEVVSQEPPVVHVKRDKRSESDLATPVLLLNRGMTEWERVKIGGMVFLAK